MRIIQFLVCGIIVVVGRFLGEMDTESLDKALAEHDEALVMFYTED